MLAAESGSTLTESQRANQFEFNHVTSPDESSLSESKTPDGGTAFPDVRAIFRMRGSPLRDRDFEIEFGFWGSILAMKAARLPLGSLSSRRLVHEGTGGP
jgi:hypothetical protein